MKKCFEAAFGTLMIITILIGFADPGSVIYLSSADVDTIFILEADQNGIFGTKLKIVENEEVWDFDSNKRSLSVTVKADQEVIFIGDFRTKLNPVAEAVRCLQISVGVK